MQFLKSSFEDVISRLNLDGFRGDLLQTKANLKRLRPMSRDSITI